MTKHSRCGSRTNDRNGSMDGRTGECERRLGFNIKPNESHLGHHYVLVWLGGNWSSHPSCAMAMAMEVLDDKNRLRWLNFNG